MGSEVNLLVNYPRTQRNLQERAKKTEEDRNIARQFGREFFDGERKHGYGGFNYNPKYWQSVIPTIQDYYQLNSHSSVLDVGCAKGFMLYDMMHLIPNMTVKGVDVSSYAIKNSVDEVQPHVQVADVRNLPFDDKSFDLVISINTIHNLEQDDIVLAINEMQRVSRKSCYLTVDAYRDENEKENMFAWNLTAKTIMSTDEWKIFFKKVGYEGDYYWFIP